MYHPHVRYHAGSLAHLYTYYSVLNMLFRKTLAPGDGNTSDITLHKEFASEDEGQIQSI
jgi:hypothetical protein